MNTSQLTSTTPVAPAKSWWNSIFGAKKNALGNVPRAATPSGVSTPVATPVATPPATPGAVTMGGRRRRGSKKTQRKNRAKKTRKHKSRH